MKIHMVAAVEKKWGIGKDGALPWNIPEEFAYFVSLVTGDVSIGRKNLLISGRRSWECGGPLPNTYTAILSKELTEKPEGADILANSLEELVGILKSDCWKDKFHHLWCVGGADIYDLVQRSAYCGIVFITKIKGHYPSDRFYPAKYLEENFELCNDIPDEFLKHIPEEGRREEGKWKVFAYQNKN